MDFKSIDPMVPTLKGSYRFFCWCSGARLYLLKRCPTDFNVFFGIGMIVFLTGVMATLSGSYAFFTIFQNPYLAMGFGLFWGTLIFFFDWYLVSSLKKENKFIKELITASPRIILAVFLAVVISRPLELKLFESEINGQLETMSQEKYNKYKEVVGVSFIEVEQLQNQNKEFQRTIDELLTQRNMLFELLVEEAEGRSPIAKTGKGSVYREKKAEYDRVNKIYEEEKARLYPLIDANNRRLSQLKSERDQQLVSGNQTLRSAIGFLARLEAYGQLGEQNKGIRYTGWFILFMFICIETGPMFVKLISKRGAYDELLSLEEAKVISQSRQELTQISEKTHRLNTVEKMKSQARLDEELEYSKDFARLLVEAQAEVGREHIKRWKERELRKIDESLEDFQPTIEELIEEAKAYMKPN
ncbi:MAG: hypothetical protein A2W95_11790 [Bacteroidetes bacterium GWA2_40_14]|nr:MAG: hypothetical protein A2W95_11790 [Bacteroidetes bacterium GWA2_40_14]HAZ04540.1 hypothetical protein [Marinilabiliales bacterium]